MMIHAIMISVDPTQPITIIQVEMDWEAMAEAVNGNYIERVTNPLTRDHGLVAIVDEEGMYSQPINNRAWPLYPFAGYNLYGTVLVVQEGRTADGEIDFIDMANPERTLAIVRELLDSY